VEGAGELIRHEPIEHGVIYNPAGKALYYVRSRLGEPSKVVIPIGKAGLVRGNVFVHNHPESQSFSVEDIWILLRHRAREVRAYGALRAFRMVATDRMRRFGYREESTGIAELKLLYGRAVEASDGRFARLVSARLLTSEEAWAAQTHNVVRRIAIHFRFAYWEIRR
jgi:hypothetical protein